MPLAVLSAVNNVTNKTRYYAIDHSSGGYPWWAPSLSQAQFLTAEEATAIMNKIKEQGDQDRYPEHLLHNALDISNKHPVGEVTFNVLVINFETVATRIMQGVIRVTYHTPDSRE